MAALLVASGMNGAQPFLGEGQRDRAPGLARSGSLRRERALAAAQQRDRERDQGHHGRGDGDQQKQAAPVVAVGRTGVLGITSGLAARIVRLAGA